MFGEIKNDPYNINIYYSKHTCPLEPLQLTSGYIVAEYRHKLRSRFPNVEIYSKNNIVVMHVMHISLIDDLQKAINYMNAQLH